MWVEQNVILETALVLYADAVTDKGREGQSGDASLGVIGTKGFPPLIPGLFST